MANVTYDEIFATVLTLPPLYRAMLVEHLLKSLDEIHPQVNTTWETEIVDTLQLRKPGLSLGSCIFNDDFDDPLPDEFWLGEI